MKFGDSDILPFVRINQLKCVALAKRLDSTRAVSRGFNNNTERSRPTGPKNR